MLQNLKRWLLGIIQAIRVWAFRKYYRLISAWGWRGQRSATHYKTLEIPIEDTVLAARLYSPDKAAERPLVVYFHGGGWVIGDLRTHHPFCQALCGGIMHWFWNTYLGDHTAKDPGVARAFPLRSATLASLPPTLMVTAENDPLRDEGIAYAEKLRDAGVPVKYRHFDSAEHGFACSQGPNSDFQALMEELQRWMRQPEETAK